MIKNRGQINHSVPIPLYYQLKELILQEIRSGNYKSGDMIATEQELSEMFSLSRTTVRQATAELVREGWLVKVKSRGTFVSMPRITQNIANRLWSFEDSIEALGLRPSTEVLELKILTASETRFDAAKKLNRKKDDLIIFLRRKLCADEESIVTVQSFLPYGECSEVMTHDYSKEKLYDILACSEKTRIIREEQMMEAVEADTETAKLLGIRKGKALYRFETIGYNASGEPVEFSIASYRGDRSCFTATVFPERKEKKQHFNKGGEE